MPGDALTLHSEGEPKEMVRQTVDESNGPVGERLCEVPLKLALTHQRLTEGCAADGGQVGKDVVVIVAKKVAIYFGPSDAPMISMVTTSLSASVDCGLQERVFFSPCASKESSIEQDTIRTSSSVAMAALHCQKRGGLHPQFAMKRPSLKTCTPR